MCKNNVQVTKCLVIKSRFKLNSGRKQESRVAVRILSRELHSFMDVTIIKDESEIFKIFKPEDKKKEIRINKFLKMRFNIFENFRPFSKNSDVYYNS